VVAFFHRADVGPRNGKVHAAGHRHRKPVFVPRCCARTRSGLSAARVPPDPPKGPRRRRRRRLGGVSGLRRIGFFQ